MDKKQEIMALLKKEAEVVFSKLCATLSMNKYYAERYLKELETEGVIEKELRGSYTYYKLKGVKKK
ncbi:hypothetical protein M0R04_09875 [Candidatus Dojkabacteria bacterium]|jgi:predicted ArsR family transcriptional regulator|nr:hypothetical protein [Candidatus Dojkabacteria bacterium]